MFDTERELNQEPSDRVPSDEVPFDVEPTDTPRRGVLPDGLADMVPGPELAEVLASVDRTALNGHELVIMVQARARLISHMQAGLYADMSELAYTPPGDERSPADRLAMIDEFCADEIAAALRYTPRQADNHLSVAFFLSDHPQLFQALTEGRIDVDHIKAFSRETAHLDADEASDICNELVDDASEWTARQLAGRLRRRCLDRHPDKAKKRYDDAVAERRVESHSNPNGTADLCARQLPPHRAAAITERIHTMAKHLARQGDERTADQIRADIFMDLLEGKPTHKATGRAGVEIRVDLTTLLGLDDHSADIPGWGPVIADLARQLAQQQTDTTWTYTITDPDTGQPLHTGTTRRRPTTAQARHVRATNPTCTFPGCPTPATRCHLDHTIAHTDGGPTHTLNLGPLCARHHLRAKHRAGWTLTLIEPGHYRWKSPRGHTYQTRPAPP